MAGWKMLEFITLILIVVGALNWGLVGLFKVDLVAALFGKMTVATRTLYVLVGVAALLHAFSRDYYLPFLGETVYPCGALTAKTPKGADKSVTVQVAPNANVIFWAAEPAASAAHPVAENPWLAYDEFANAGVARSDASGVAVLKVRRPGQYKVSFGRALPAHVHYRVCSRGGMLGAVQTVQV